MARKQRWAVPPPLFATSDIEWAQGDGMRIKVGSKVYQPPKQSPTWGLVPSRRGKVVRVYVREGSDRQLVDTSNGHTLEASKCRRSAFHEQRAPAELEVGLDGL